MNMKKQFLSVVGLLLMGAATAMASNTLVLHLASGQTQRFVLLNEQPTISFTGDDVVVKTSTSEMVYAMTDVKFFNYETVATAIEGTQADGLKIDGDRIVYDGLPAGCKVQVFDVAGHVCGSAVADESGHAVVSIVKFSAGVYMVNANNVSTKFTKK